MANIIAVWGAPNSGKTTLCMQLAKQMATAHNPVYVIFADDQVPTLPVLFPQRDELKSIGNVLISHEINSGLVMKHSITTASMPNVAFLGYGDRETSLSFPQVSAVSYEKLIQVVRELAKTIIIDCTSIPNELSLLAIRLASTTYRCVSADLKSLAFMGSQLPLLSVKKHQITVLSITAKDVPIPLDDYKKAFEEPSILPYSKALRQQYSTGDLMEPLGDKKYNQAMTALIQTRYRKGVNREST